MPRIAPASSNKHSTSNSIGKGWLKHDNTLKGAWTFRTKEKIQCLCEGGSRCSKESPEAQKDVSPIEGLHANWVGEDACMLAMARPWHQNMIKYKLADAFVKHNIGMVLNLQEVGEHDHCGPGNLPHCGFSYDPEMFMAARIGFFNFSWQDMGVPDLDRMMDIVQVMDYTVVVEKRKVAVHCHAGLGRTGLAIACYILYQHRKTGMCCSKKVIQTVRQGRPGALQTRTQELFVSIFQQYLLHLSCLFGGVEGPPKGLQSLHSHANLAAMPSQPQALQQQQQQQASPPRPTPSGLSSLGLLLSRRGSSPLKASTLPSGSSKPQEGAGGSLGAPSTPLSLSSSLATSSASLPSQPGSMKGPSPLHKSSTDSSGAIAAFGVPPAAAATTKVFEHGLKIVGPAPPRTAAANAKGSANTRAASPELMRGTKQQQQQPQQQHRPPPWDDKKGIYLSRYSTSWVPQPPTSYAEALTRQQRLLHGGQRRSYCHLHRFVKKAVYAIISAAQEARKAQMQRHEDEDHGQSTGHGMLSLYQQQQQQQQQLIEQYNLQQVQQQRLQQQRQQQLYQMQKEQELQQQREQQEREEQLLQQQRQQIEANEKQEQDLMEQPPQQQQQQHAKQQLQQQQQQQHAKQQLQQQQQQQHAKQQLQQQQQQDERQGVRQQLRPLPLTLPTLPAQSPTLSPFSHLPTQPASPLPLSALRKHSDASSFNLEPIEHPPDKLATLGLPQAEKQQHAVQQQAHHQPRKQPPLRAKLQAAAPPQLPAELLPQREALQQEAQLPPPPPPQQQQQQQELQVATQPSTLPPPVLLPEITPLPHLHAQPHAQPHPPAPSAGQPSRPAPQPYLEQPNLQQPPATPSAPAAAPPSPLAGQHPSPHPPHTKQPPQRARHSEPVAQQHATHHAAVPASPQAIAPYAPPPVHPAVGHTHALALGACSPGPPPPGPPPPTALARHDSAQPHHVGERAAGSGPAPPGRAAAPPAAPPPPAALTKHTDSSPSPQAAGVAAQLRPPSAPIQHHPLPSAAQLLAALDDSSVPRPAGPVRPPPGPVPPTALARHAHTHQPLHAFGGPLGTLPQQANSPHMPAPSLRLPPAPPLPIELRPPPGMPAPPIHTSPGVAAAPAPWPPPHHHSRGVPVAEGVDNPQQPCHPDLAPQTAPGARFAGARARRSLWPRLMAVCAAPGDACCTLPEDPAQAAHCSHTHLLCDVPRPANPRFPPYLPARSDQGVLLAAQPGPEPAAQQVAWTAAPSVEQSGPVAESLQGRAQLPVAAEPPPRPSFQGLHQGGGHGQPLRPHPLGHGYHQHQHHLHPSLGGPHDPQHGSSHVSQLPPSSQRAYVQAHGRQSFGQQGAGHTQWGTHQQQPQHQQHPQQQLQMGREQGGSGAGPLQPCHSFAHALSMCAMHHDLELQGMDVVASLARSAPYRTLFVGGMPAEARAGGEAGVSGGEDLEGLHSQLQHQLAHLKRRSNHEDFQATSRAPLLLVVQVLQDFFVQFHGAGPVLSKATLAHAAAHYRMLHYEGDASHEQEQRRAAAEVIAPIPVQDQELLLLFAALMRHSELAGGDEWEAEEGPEQHIVAIGRWALHLLVGPNTQKRVEEPLLCLLWYFLRNDIAYATLLAAKKKRMDKLVHGGAPPVHHPDEDPLLAKYRHARHPLYSRTDAHTRHTQQQAHAALPGQQAPAELPGLLCRSESPVHLQQQQQQQQQQQAQKEAPCLMHGIFSEGAMQAASLAAGAAGALPPAPPRPLPPAPEIHDAWK